MNWNNHDQITDFCIELDSIFAKYGVKLVNHGKEGLELCNSDSPSIFGVVTSSSTSSIPIRLVMLEALGKEEHE